MEALIIGIVIGLIVGGGACWLIRSARAKSDAASQEAAYRENLANLQGQLAQTVSAQEVLETAKTQLRETFQATASQALQGNNEQFLQLAQQNLGTTLEAAKREFDNRHLQFQELVKPLSENYGKLNPQIESLITQTSELSGALKDNRRIGQWGEIQLRNVVERAGMTDYCDFEVQVTADGSRPDMIVKLPERRTVVVDAKASTSAYLDAQQAGDDETAREALNKHAGALKRQVDDLASKDYGRKVPDALDFVVMFIPGDQFLSAALSSNPELLEYAMGKRIAVATPASLIAMLWAINHGWQQARLAESAEAIKEAGEEMHTRMLNFIARYQDVGRELNQAVTAYNRSIGSFDGRVVPQGRRFAGLVTGTEDSFRVPETIDQTPRISRHAPSSEVDGR